MRKFRSPEEWRKVILDQQQSGLSISAFCRQHNISSTGFFIQRKKHGLMPDTTSAFISTKITKQSSTEIHHQASQAVVLELTVGTVKFPADTPAQYLVTLLNGLQHEAVC